MKSHDHIFICVKKESIGVEWVSYRFIPIDDFPDKIASKELVIATKTERFEINETIEVLHSDNVSMEVTP